MNRSEMKRMINNEIKEISTFYKYKKRGSMIYKLIGNYFVNIFIHLPSEKCGSVVVRGKIKPLWVDEVFWSVLKAPEGNMPLSLRGNGAFVFPAATFFNENCRIDEVESLHRTVEQLFIKCDKICNSLLNEFTDEYRNFCDRIRNIDSCFDVELYTILLLIKEQEYSKVIELIDVALMNGRKGRFYLDNQSIYEIARDLCKSKIS